jgi:hypothetical protein
MFGIKSQTTPKKITPKITKFCLDICGTRPDYLNVVGGWPEGKCHLNTLHYVEKNPTAKIQFGWVIWEASWILEAEFHSVICENGILKCITDMKDGERKILFAPDFKRKAEFFHMNNHIGIVRYNNCIWPDTHPIGVQHLIDDCP